LTEQKDLYASLLLNQAGKFFLIYICSLRKQVSADIRFNQNHKKVKKIFILIAIIASVAACRGPLSKPGTAEAGTETGVTGDKPGKVTLEKQDITIEKTEGVTTIAELYSDLKKFKGETIRVKGKVTKVNPSIMNKNWIHLQDGSDHNGEFDLTITTDQEFQVGTVVTVEGKIALDKDFGYGYSYKVLLEEGKIVQ
jgi:predicted small lipoprotein YifL